MVQTVMNSTYKSAKTAEIMARYRPIAPKPLDVPANHLSDEGLCCLSTMSDKIQQSAYLKNVWPRLQARPTRTRKRGRTEVSPPAIKKSRTFLQAISPPLVTTATSPPANKNNLSLQAFFTSDGLNLVTLPLPPSTSEFMSFASYGAEKGTDLKMGSISPNPRIIAPQPVRPVGSRISILGRIIEDPGGRTIDIQDPKTKTAEEVEEEVELEALPAVVSASDNRVRFVNSAYREMVGQPECSWLTSMATCDGRSCKRICGEVMLQLSSLSIPSNGFSCWVRIEWGSNGKKNAVDTFCDAIRLACESKDYIFAWRFHIGEVSSSEKASS